MREIEKGADGQYRVERFVPDQLGERQARAV